MHAGDNYQQIVNEGKIVSAGSWLCNFFILTLV